MLVLMSPAVSSFFLNNTLLSLKSGRQLNTEISDKFEQFFHKNNYGRE